MALDAYVIHPSPRLLLVHCERYFLWGYKGVDRELLVVVYLDDIAIFGILRG